MWVGTTLENPMCFALTYEFCDGLSLDIWATDWRNIEVCTRIGDYLYQAMSNLTRNKGGWRWGNAGTEMKVISKEDVLKYTQRLIEGSLRVNLSKGRGNQKSLATEDISLDSILGRNLWSDLHCWFCTNRTSSQIQYLFSWHKGVHWFASMML